MPQPATDIENTTLYPPYASKADFLLDLGQAMNGGGGNSKLWEVVIRMSNTDTATWADSTARHTDSGLI